MANGSKIDIKIVIPIVISLVAGAVVWGAVHNTVENVQAKVIKIEEKDIIQDQNYNDLNLDVKTRLTNIEAILRERLPK